jgi:DNA-binding SARP family transcriptional activator/streptogramin lyase
VEFRILGPLEIRDDDDREVPLRQGGERALLALLLLRANEIVSIDRIVDALWGERAPPTAQKIVRNRVSHLRQLVDGALVTVGSGYRLEVPPESIDRNRFEALAARGRRELDSGDSERALATHEEALALWRGAPLEELAYQPFAQGEIARLEELREAVVEGRIDALLELGRHDLAIPELEERVAVEPLRERPRGQLMLALYRAGRQADALEQYREARAALVEELGLEPSEELRRLERAILDHDPSLAPPPSGLPNVEERSAPPPPRPRRQRPRLLAAAGALVLVAAVVAALVRILAGGGSAAVGHAVAVLDPETGEVVSRIAVGKRPVAVAVGAGGVWVASADDGTVSRIDPRTGEVVATIGLGVPASDIAVGAGSVWATSGSLGTLIRIDPRSNAPVDTIDLSGSEPLAPNAAHGVAVGSGAVWVGSGSRSVARVAVATRAVAATVRVGVAPASLVTDAGDVWAATRSRVARIDSRTNEVTATVAHSSFSATLAAGAGAVWLAESKGSLWRIDPETAVVTAGVPLLASTSSVAVLGSDVWVASATAGTVTRVDARSLAVTKVVALGAEALDVATGDGAVWVSLGETMPQKP